MTFTPAPKPKRKHRRRPGIPPAQRKRLLARANGRCERCGKGFDWRGYQIAHLTNRGMGGTRDEYSDDELEVTCASCHAPDHGIREV